MKPKTKLSKSLVLFYSAAIIVGAVSGRLGHSESVPTILAQSQTPKPVIDELQMESFEGQNVSSVEIAGRPDLKTEDFTSLFAQREGEPFARAKADATLAALKKSGRFQDIQLDVRPEPEGVRVLFVAQPAVYFGMFDFTGTGPFAYSRLLQASNYPSQAPYSTVDVRRAETALQTFFQRNGYFESQTRSEIQIDKAHDLANVVFHVTLNRLADFGEVNIVGTPPQEAEHIRAALRSWWARLHTSAIRPGRKYSLKTLQNATQYLENHLTKDKYLASQVRLIGANYNPQTHRADITFNVNQGPQVNVQIQGARVSSGRKRKLLPIYDQAGLTPELIQEGRQNLIQYFKSQGYFDVKIATDLKQEANGETVLYRIEKGPRKRIKDVVFTGNAHFSEDDLEQHVLVEKAGFLSHGKYNESSVKTLKATYQAAGFNQVKVTPQFRIHDGHMDVVFVIDEGPQDLVDSFRIEGNHSLGKEQFAPDGLRLAPGQPYSQKYIDDDRNKIMSHYLEEGYLTASFHETAQPLPDNPHRFRVAYIIEEGPQVHASSVVTLGRKNTKQELINKDTASLQAGRPLVESQLLSSESRLYTTGIFDWAQVDPRRQITNQRQEDVIVKVHESKRNAITYGLGWEVVSRGGSVPTGTVAVPGLPPIGLPNTFKTNQHRYSGPRASIQYTRMNVRGKAETITVGALGGPLMRRASFAWMNPTLRWTNWSSNFTFSGEKNYENPIFNSRQGQLSWQLQKPLDQKKTRNIFLRYSFTETGLNGLVIPDLVPREDRHTRLSTFSANYTRDTRDNMLDAHKGNYESFQIDTNSRILGSSVSFGKLLMQTAYYRTIGSSIVWASSLRLGMEQPFGGSHVPLSEKFFTGGGSTLRGFPLNGAGPQRSIPACGNPADPSSCAFIRVPVGGTQLLILNSEFRIPLPIRKNLSLVTFYDGGNVYDRIGFHQFRQGYTNSVGLGFRYATPVGPIRIDIGHNMNRLSGIRATQVFITLGQAF